MELKLTTTEITQAGTTLKNSAEEIQNAAQKASSSMSQLTGMVSPALQRDIDQWNQLKQSITKAVAALQDASVLLKKLAIDNENANK